MQFSLVLDPLASDIQSVQVWGDLFWTWHFYQINENKKYKESYIQKYDYIQ